MQSDLGETFATGLFDDADDFLVNLSIVDIIRYSSSSWSILTVYVLIRGC